MSKSKGEFINWFLFSCFIELLFCPDLRLWSDISSIAEDCWSLFDFYEFLTRLFCSIDIVWLFKIYELVAVDCKFEDYYDKKFLLFSSTASKAPVVDF